MPPDGRRPGSRALGLKANWLHHRPHVLLRPPRERTWGRHGSLSPTGRQPGPSTSAPSTQHARVSAAGRCGSPGVHAVAMVGAQAQKESLPNNTPGGCDHLYTHSHTDQPHTVEKETARTT